MMHDLVAKTHVIDADASAEPPVSQVTWWRVGLMALGATMFVGLSEDWLWDRQLSFALAREATALERELSETVKGGALRKVYVARSAYAEDPAYVEVALPPELSGMPAEAATGVARAVLAVYPRLESHQELRVRVGLREPLARRLMHTFERTRRVDVWESLEDANLDFSLRPGKISIR